ncbi:MAG: PTS sugar transporter subunit IIA [Erythrobacter sp.]|jgi:PTS system nitrogen regulatory IIA component|nr:PTS sugar transporter subunit IIA [Erythrobacter sp.]
MDINILMQSDAVRIADLDSKPRVLEAVADIFQEAYALDREAVLEGLGEREALGSTGFGRGVAIPHCRIGQVHRPTAALIRLESPCEFGAADAVPVNLVFGLVSPENAGAAHLHALAAISRLSRAEVMLQALSDAEEPEALFALLTNQFLRDAA